MPVKDRLNPFFVGDDARRRVTVEGDGTITCEGVRATDTQPGAYTGMRFRNGYVVLPDAPSDPQAMEAGSMCYDPVSGRIIIKDAFGVREL